MKRQAIKLKTYVWISIGFVVAFGICLGMFLNVMSAVGSLNAAHVWAGESEMRFAQLGIFFPEDNKASERNISDFFMNAEKKLSEAAVEEEDGKRLYNYAYSGSSKVTVNSERGSQTVSAIGVGGDFFFFHPLRLCSGSYISHKDFTDDRVVLDKELAWAVFGGINVEGMELNINSVKFKVAGVVEREDDFATQKTYDGGAGLFMSYSAFNKLTGCEISSFEVVMPDPISGFSLGIAKESFEPMNAQVIENSKRYSLPEIMKLAGNFGERSIQKSGIIYPYWENAVRVTESYLCILFVLMIIFGGFPLVTLIVVLSRLISAKIKYIKEVVPKKIEEHIEAKKEENYRKTGGQ